MTTSTVINGGERVPQTEAELDAFLAEYKKKNPVKFARKEANGEFKKFRTKLLEKLRESKGLMNEPSAKLEQEPEKSEVADTLQDLGKKELVALAKERGLELRGDEKVSELRDLLQA